MFEDDIFHSAVEADLTPQLLKGLSIVSLLTGPVFIVLLLWFCWIRRGRWRVPPVLAAVPLALTSISIQVFVAVLGIIRAFQSIAESGSAGVGAVAAAFEETVRPVMWRLVLAAACVGAAAMVQILYLRHQRSRGETDAEYTPPASDGHVAWPLGGAVAVAVVAWATIDTVDLSMMIADPARAAAAQARLGDIGIGAVSEMLSNRLVMIALGSGYLTYGLLAAGLSAIEPGRPKSWHIAVSFALAVAVISGCAAGAVFTNGELQYLTLLASGATEPAPPIQ